MQAFRSWHLMLIGAVIVIGLGLAAYSANDPLQLSKHLLNVTEP